MEWMEPSVLALLDGLRLYEAIVHPLNVVRRFLQRCMSEV